MSKPRVCSECPYLKNDCVVRGIWDDAAKVTFILENPSWVSTSVGSTNYSGIPLRGRSGVLLRRVSKVAAEVIGEGVPFNAVYASGSSEDPNAKSIAACANIWKAAWLNRYTNSLDPHVFIPLGMKAVRSLGIKARKVADVRGTVMKATIGNREAVVVPTLSSKHVYAKPGLVNVLMADALKGIRIAHKSAELASVPLAELSKEYVYPETIEDVASVCDSIIGYYDPAKQNDPTAWPIAVDLETNTLETHKEDARINMISFGWDDGKACAIVLDHPDVKYDPAEAWGHVRRVLTCPKPKIFHNGKFDIKFLSFVGDSEVVNWSWDTLLAEHWLDEDKKGEYGLKKIVRGYLPAYANYDAELDAHKPKGKDKGFEEIPLDVLLPYAAADADVTRQITKHQHRKLSRKAMNEAECSNVLTMLTIPASRTLGRMEHRGIKVNQQLLQQYKESLDEQLLAISEKIYTLCLSEFNLNADIAVANILIGCGIPLTERTEKTQQLSVTKAVLESFIPGYVNTPATGEYDNTGVITDLGRLHIIENFLLYKTLYKMRNTFLVNVDKRAAMDGRVHSSFHVAGTSTGRLSSSNLNMQNIPPWMGRYVRYTDNEDVVLCRGYNVKDLFIPDTNDQVFFNADIKAAEIRGLTLYSQDKQLIEAINSGIDIHTVILTRVEHPELNPELSDAAFMSKYREYAALKEAGDKKVNDLRKAIKRTVFGTLYGAKSFKIATQLGDSSEEGIAFAQSIIDGIFGSFPGVKDYMERTSEEVYKNNIASTVFGRYRRFGMANMYRSLLAKAIREAVNFRIQSTASDLVVMALCEIEKHIHEIGGTVSLTVHDSIAGSIERSKLPLLTSFLDKHIVEGTRERLPQLPVAFEYDIEVGPSYGSLQSLSSYLEENSMETSDDR